MIEPTKYTVSPELVEQALIDYPITDEVVVLNEHDGDFFYGNWTIKSEYKDTPWEQILNSLDCTIGEARIITLKPGESYQAHSDIDDRWHLSLTGDYSFLIDLENQTMFKCERDYRWYIMDTSKVHTACNFGSVPRLELVVRERLRKPETFNDCVQVIITPLNMDEDIRYKFDNVFSPWLNKVNFRYMMSDFDPNLGIVKFKMERELIDELNSLITSDFKIDYEPCI